ncbi:MAG TPA: CBS domain-containing protein [Methanothermobacter sp.]|jgi:CBS domain-containing protein|uniref:CBS domain-containing protein n=1 Tax=Methanothermobacter tenebrarum TaxID=680118 RepID=A0ABN6P9E4_9EURY|nr:CBS domain-containing protein [Methanothermobacter tenebrarum]MDD3454028.1 CBS domain-containing protein [Methanobacteriales archaeon]MDX9694080.1 CBS domain-containing protein [Methanothermobacter sp.]BDH78822.1 CBS domain-containing protein [Methanothermobacter tenebrarum]HHW17032.1 CBS domain-containing protein [Methanothermobacter sp.]
MRKKDTINIVKSLDRGPVEFESRNFEHEGDIMSIAQKEVVSIPPTISIKEAAEIMVKNKFRRLPITDPGTKKLLGIITSMDILDFLGGGDKSKILEEKYDDNFLAAINEPVRKIMTRNVKYTTLKDSITDAVEMMLKYNIGALPVVNHEKKLVGIVSERDFVFLMAGVLNDEIVADHMTENLITTTPGTPIEGASKIMVRNQFRRLPIVGEERKTPHPEKEKLVGIVTSTDILEFLGSNRVFDTIKTNSAEEALNTPVSEIMEKKVVTINSTSTLGQLYEIMAKNSIGGVPVVDYDELLGIITESDLLKAIAL